MPILNINGNVLVQTAAQWAADATVYAATKILITSDLSFTGADIRRFKIADGVQTWAGLDYLPDTNALINASVRRILVIFSCAQFNPADATSYFFGNIGGVIANISSVARFRIEAPATGVLNRIRLNGTFAAGSAQAATWKINNVTAGTSVTITSSFSFAAAGNFPAVFTALGLAVTLGDELEMQLDCPTWTPTNPTNLNITCIGTIDIT